MIAFLIKKFYIPDIFYRFPVFIFCFYFNDVEARTIFSICHRPVAIYLYRICFFKNLYPFGPTLIICFIIIFIVRKVGNEFLFAHHKLVRSFPIAVTDQPLFFVQPGDCYFHLGWFVFAIHILGADRKLL